MKKQQGLRSYIKRRILYEENVYGTLPQKDAEFLTSLCIETVDKLCTKFIKGAKAHGGSILDRSGLAELDDELIDSIVYLQAAKTQLRNL